jgi:hypothetical protein
LGSAANRFLMVWASMRFVTYTFVPCPISDRRYEK